jgi:tetratricopeptide (TPR) repeat protein
MRITPAVLLILTSQLFLFADSPAQEDYYSPPQVYQFAEYLYQDKDYLRAAGEFQRYLLMNEPSIGRDSIQFKIAICYRLGSQPERAIGYFQRVIDENPQSSYRDRASYQIGYSYYAMGQYMTSIQFIGEHCSPSSEYRSKLNNLLVSDYLYLKDWKKAYNVSTSFLREGYDSIDSLTADLNQLTQEGIRLPRKSVVLASLMSAVVPGTGKMYAHRFMDGLYSLMIIGLTSWQAYEGFKDDGVYSTKGWIYGSIGGVLYLGNIYGSMIVVKVHNREIEDKFLMKVGQTLRR